MSKMFKPMHSFFSEGHDCYIVVSDSVDTAHTVTHTYVQLVQ